MIIKVILILAVIIAVAYVARSAPTGRQLAIRRLVALMFALGWVVAVLAPDGVVTRIANLMGVGRGADLVLYVLAVAFLFTTVAQRLRIRDLDDRVARLTRELALMDVRDPRADRSECSPDDATGIDD